MRILVVGSGGVGDAVARIAARRSFFELMVMADYDVGRAARAVEAARAASTTHGRGSPDRFVAEQVDASDAAAVTALATRHGITHVLNAVDPRFVMPVFTGALGAGADYLDMAMSLSRPHPTHPNERTGVKLGDEQLAAAGAWSSAGRLALLGMGVEPGLSNVFARYASDHLFERVEELGTRDGSNLVVLGEDGEPVFAPSFSIWTTIEECLNPPVIWDADRAVEAGSIEGGWYTVPPFHEPEVFDFPGGIGPVECVHVEHEEVLLMPRFLDAQKVTFKYGLGEEFISVLRTLHRLGLDRTEPVQVRAVRTPGETASVDDGSSTVLVSPRDVVAASLPDPATLGDRMQGVTCAGLLVTGTGRHGAPREVYLHHLVDNAWSMAEYGSQCVVWQTAVNPVVALELLASGAWSGTGVVGPEAFDAVPFLELLAAPEPAGFGSPWALQERPVR